MLFELLRAILVANPIGSFPLQALVHEVGRLLVPTRGYIRLLDRNLAEKYLISNILARSALIGPFAHHTLVSDDAHRKVIRSQPMVLPAHHLGCHVPRGTTCFGGVVRGEDASDAEIGKAEVPLIVENQIFRLNIPVDYQL